MTLGGSKTGRHSAAKKACRGGREAAGSAAGSIEQGEKKGVGEEGWLTRRIKHEGPW
jgi:hypothetical protein